MSKDTILPSFAGRMNLKYGTPRVALAMAGGPVLVLTATGQVELLAEAASVFHLVVYALMCVALIRMRRNEPEWYDPAFRAPEYPLVAGIGAVASAGPILFTQPVSRVIGAAIVLASAGWYKYYASDVRFNRVPKRVTTVSKAPTRRPSRGEHGGNGRPPHPPGSQSGSHPWCSGRSKLSKAAPSPTP